MDPGHLWFFSVSCVEWVCVVVGVRLREVAAAWPEIGLWPEIESWWAIASMSFAEYRIEA
jgi:hypothetical protein